MGAAKAELYGLVVRFELAQGHEAAFDQLTAETVERIRADEPGTLVYMTHAGTGTPMTRVFYELYRDRAAFDAHEETPHVRRFLAERGQHLGGDPQVWRLAVEDGIIRPDLGFDGG